MNLSHFFSSSSSSSIPPPLKSIDDKQLEKSIYKFIETLEIKIQSKAEEKKTNEQHKQTEKRKLNASTINSNSSIVIAKANDGQSGNSKKGKLVELN